MVVRVRFVLFLLVFGFCAFGQEAVSDAKTAVVEQNLIDDIIAASKDVAYEKSICDTREERCSFRRLSRARFVLADLVAQAETFRTDLLKRQEAENDPDKAELQAKRAANLLRSIVGTRDLLVDLGPAPKELTAEERAIAREATLRKEIEQLADDIARETALCEKDDDRCSRSRRSRLRFELRDRLDEVETTRADLLKKQGEEKDPDKAENLAKRAANLLRGINAARDITFDAQGTALAGDELLDTVKALGRNLDVAVEKNEVANTDDTKKETKLASQRLAQAERKLREQGMGDRESIAEIEKKMKTGTLEPAQYGQLAAKKKHLGERVEATEELVTLPASDNPLFRVYDDDHEDWWIHEFYAGMEFDSVSGIFSKGFARIGYSASARVGGENVPESRPHRAFRWDYGRYYEFNALLTSSAEQNFRDDFVPDATATDPCEPGFTGTERCIRKALEVEQKLFWPILRMPRHNRIRPYFGPVISLGARFVDPVAEDDPEISDASARADYRYYGGFHFGFARDAYAEAIYGRTRSLRSRRLEVRGEIPVAHFGNESRLLLGWAANFGVGHERDRTPTVEGFPQERDVFRVFLVYDVDFLKLPIGLKTPKKEE